MFSVNREHFILQSKVAAVIGEVAFAKLVVMHFDCGAACQKLQR